MAPLPYYMHPACLPVFCSSNQTHRCTQRPGKARVMDSLGMATFWLQPFVHPHWALAEQSHLSRLSLRAHSKLCAQPKLAGGEHCQSPASSHVRSAPSPSCLTAGRRQSHCCWGCGGPALSSRCFRCLRANAQPWLRVMEACLCCWAPREWVPACREALRQVVLGLALPILQQPLWESLAAHVQRPGSAAAEAPAALHSHLLLLLLLLLLARAQSPALSEFVGPSGLAGCQQPGAGQSLRP